MMHVRATRKILQEWKSGSDTDGNVFEHGGCKLKNQSVSRVETQYTDVMSSILAYTNELYNLDPSNRVEVTLYDNEEAGQHNSQSKKNQVQNFYPMLAAACRAYRHETTCHEWACFYY